MSMNINGYTSAVNAYLHTSGDYENGIKKTSAPVKARNTDKVEFSKAAKAASAESFGDVLAAAKAAAAGSADPSAQEEKISALKNAVSSGSYFISSSDIASSILGAF